MGPSCGEEGNRETDKTLLSVGSMVWDLVVVKREIERQIRHCLV